MLALTRGWLAPPSLTFMSQGCGGNHVKCNNGVCGSTFPSGRKLAM
jgi:hypothetical protein